MDIGIPKQKRPFDYRVGLTPMGVEVLTRSWATACYVEHDAGQGSGFEDERYRQAGAQIVYSPEEVYGRGETDPHRLAPAAAGVRSAPGGADPVRLPAPGGGAPAQAGDCCSSARSPRSPTRRSRPRTATCRCCRGQPDRRPDDRRHRRAAPAEQRGRARHPAGRRAGRAAGQGGHPGRGHRRRQRGAACSSAHGRGCDPPGHRPAQAARAGGARLHRRRPWWRTTSISPRRSSAPTCWWARC